MMRYKKFFNILLIFILQLISSNLMADINNNFMKIHTFYYLSNLKKISLLFNRKIDLSPIGNQYIINSYMLFTDNNDSNFDSFDLEISSTRQNLRKAIIGKWITYSKFDFLGTQFEGKVQIEFFEDGTISIYDEKFNLSTVGDYKFISDDKIRIDFKGIVSLLGPAVYTISISGNKLYLKSAKGDVEIYYRVEGEFEGEEEYREEKRTSFEKKEDKKQEFGNIEKFKNINYLFSSMREEVLKCPKERDICDDYEEEAAKVIISHLLTKKSGEWMHRWLRDLLLMESIKKLILAGLDEYIKFAINLGEVIIKEQLEELKEKYNKSPWTVEVIDLGWKDIGCHAIYFPYKDRDGPYGKEDGEAFIIFYSPNSLSIKEIKQQVIASKGFYVPPISLYERIKNLPDEGTIRPFKLVLRGTIFEMGELKINKYEMWGKTIYGPQVTFFDSIVECNALTWQILPNIPTSRGWPGAVAYDGKIYVIGGCYSLVPAKFQNPTNIVEVYDVAENKWKKLSSMKIPRVAPAVAALNGKIYVFGGFNRENWSANNSVEIYDISKNSWSFGPPMPTPRSWMKAKLIKNKIYVIGGVGYGYRKDVEVYDPINNRWEKKSPILHRGRYLHAVEGYNQKIFVMGGQSWENGYGENFDDLQEYDPEKDIWVYKSSMPNKAFGIDAIAYNNKLYILGGLPKKNICWIYYIFDDHWQEIKSIHNVPTTGSECFVFLDGYIYRIGGGGWGPTLDIFERAKLK